MAVRVLQNETYKLSLLQKVAHRDRNTLNLVGLLPEKSSEFCHCRRTEFQFSKRCNFLPCFSLSELCTMEYQIFFLDNVSTPLSKHSKQEYFDLLSII